MNLYTPLEVALKLNIKEAMVKRLVKEGRIKVVMLSKTQYRITEDALNEYLSMPVIKPAVKKRKWTEEERDKRAGGKSAPGTKRKRREPAHAAQAGTGTEA
jgi:excisionase family DNA binding protein